MITQIEIDGFKTFLDFKVELGPLQVLVGSNASGKSNLFDALHLLSRLAEVDLRSAFQGLRGSPDDQFTLFPNGQRSDSIRIAVELLVDRNVQDELGQKTELTYTRLRYEIAVSFKTDTYGLESPYVLHEGLHSISPDRDNWSKEHDLSVQNGWLPDTAMDQKTFIDTQLSKGRISKSVTPIAESQREYLKIFLYADGAGQGNTKSFYADEVQRTILSRTDEVDYPHVFAVREELRSLKFLHLNPDALREPSSFKSPSFLSVEGHNLPSMLARLQAEDKLSLIDISRDMANLVPGFHRVKVEKDDARGDYEIVVETVDEHTQPAQVLSDGTLRLLALATIRNDPHYHGVLCLEEPENGVHPLHLHEMARMLRAMATDFSDPHQVNEPLRQILITTHSPVFISQPEVIDALLLVITPKRVSYHTIPSVRLTQMIPVLTQKNQPSMSSESQQDHAVDIYTIDMLRKYLESGSIAEALNQLEQTRETLTR
ncbi:MAG TPA: AAA family ATPase [Ktedonobacteraceae bacterium]|nr:AAA family ATPase [Ktedonobacteraceae bacterium]